MKKWLKKIISKKIFSAYYYIWALFSALFFGFPSRKMVVIGVTGTKGKTSTINFIWAVLTAGGYKTGIISTANIRIGEKEFMNKYHMTMPDAFIVQSLMRKMKKAGCKFCIVETTSEGIKQYRHKGIHYDINIFTNLSPEHLPSHDGSFEKYKEMKGRLFESFSKIGKRIGEIDVKKSTIANIDNPHSEYYLSFPSEQKITFSTEGKAKYSATEIIEKKDGVDFKLGEEKYALSILGRFNVYNALPAIIVGHMFEISYTDIQRGLKLDLIPGRMEIIDEGQDFSVIVDYAHEKQSITNILKTGNVLRGEGGKVIILLGAEGGGRDKAKRPIMGELSAKMADFVILSNVDPYEDDPGEIILDIAKVAEKFGKIQGENLFLIEDRREGIKKALQLARKGDIVLITGKGAEQSMIIGGKSIKWDDRIVVREELRKLLLKN